MESLDDLIPIPPKDQMNTNLSSARESTMLKAFGKPGALSKNWSPPVGSIMKKMISGENVGPFKVSGLIMAVESLKQIFSQVSIELPAVYGAVKTAGMLCVRARRANPSRYSNHSWGTAIDLYFGKAVVPQGTQKTHRGVYLLCPYFNKAGWYWGAEFSGDSVDAMHFEFADETI